MKRKKQFVALLLVAVLVFGGVFPAFHPMSNVYAEEAQTEQPTETSDEQQTEPSTEAPAETQAPTEPVEPTTEEQEPTDAPTETQAPTEPVEPTETQAPTDAVEPTEAPAEQPLSVTDGVETFTIPEKAADNVPIESGSIDFEKLSWDGNNAGGTADTNGPYGNNVISMYLTGRGVEKKTGSKTLSDGKTVLTTAIKVRDNGAANTTYASVAQQGSIMVTSEKDAKITIFIETSTDAKVHFMRKDGDTLVDDKINDFVGKKGDVTGVANEQTFEIKAGEEYYIWKEGTKIQIWCVIYEYEGEAPIEFPTDPRPAFPGAEGGGMYATGGRGGDVYVVTNLNDSGEGSLREGINTAPAAGRTIVFAIGGTINLESTLTFKNKQNITIAGQTAPGDGITIAGYDTNISDSKNIIIRFVRFRVGSANLAKGGDSMDALWGRDNDTFMIDHCTFSWNTDETLSTYRGRNGTVQWCIISESLTVSGHSKGRHGYGGIFGGDNTVFQYNLMTNHTSRNPRIGGGSMTDPISDAKDPTKTPSTATLQMSNNVLYNHGFYPCYGGGYAYTNYINNYVKPGKGTRESLRNTLIHVGENGKFGGFYVAGNILEGNSEVTANNAVGIREDAPDYISNTAYTTSDTSKFDFDAFASIHPVSAADCYNVVLDSAGATFPNRDAIDARVVAQVKSDTGFYINTPDEVGGYPARTVTAADEGRVDTDNDGIPDDWEKANGLNPNDPSDSVKPFTGDTTSPNYGYSALEVYCNDLVKDVVASGYQAKNPEVSINVANNTLVNEGTPITVTATATAPAGSTIAKVEFYNGDNLVETVTNAPYTYAYTGLTDGTYNISVRAYDSEGRATQSNTSKVHVNSTAGTDKWSSTDVGTPGVKGTASLVDGVLTVKGAGKLGKSEGSVSGSALNNAASDDFHYVYQQMTGDVELVTKLDYFTAVDCHTFNGLMFRESLDTDAATVAVGLTMTKIWDGYDTVWTAFMAKRDKKGDGMTDLSETLDGASAVENAGIPAVTNLNFKDIVGYNGTWLKLTRNGNVFTGAVSDDGLLWQTIGQFTVELPETIYVGFAVEAGKAANELENYSTAKFSNIKINTSFGKITYNLENVEYAGAENFAVGDDVSIILTNIKGYLLPETVKVTIDGKEVAVDYDKEKGIISLKNLSGDVVVTAQGVKREIVQVKLEEVDPQNLLTVEEKDGKLILTQIAESGSTSSGFPGGDSYKDAVNESWVLFPEVSYPHEMTMNITVRKLLPVGKNDNTGVFIGAFDINEGRQAFDSLAFRPCAKTAEAVSKFWTKGDKTGNGGTKQPVSMDMVYKVTFAYDKAGQYTVQWESADGSKASETFKVNENYLKKGAAVRYGIGLIGATVEITDLTYTDHEGNVIYNMNPADYSAVTAAIEKANQLKAEEYENFDVVTKAIEAVVMGLTKSEQEKVDAMAKAIEDAIASLKKKVDGNVTVEGDGITITVDKDMTFVDNKGNVITNDKLYVKAVPQQNSPLASLIKPAAEDKVQYFDVNLVDSANNKVTFTGGKLTLTFKYPDGTNRFDYDFKVYHGLDNGKMEQLGVSCDDAGIKVQVDSLSPFAIVYTENEDGEYAGDTVQSVPTGDATPLALLTVLMMVSAGVLLVYRRKYEAE